MESEYDVLVIGAGAAGENAADRIVKGGLTAALIESDLVGGACSYWACEPSKALLRPGTALHAARRVPGSREAVTGDLDVHAVLEHRTEAVNSWDDESQVEWVDGAGITLVRGRARLTGAKRVSVADSAGNHFALAAPHAVVLATGSTPSIPKVPGLDRVSYWTTADATSTREVPESLAILGAGVAGSELAQAFARLGSRVTLLARGTFLSAFPEDARELVRAGLTGDGVEIIEGVSPELVESTDDGGAHLTLPDGRTLEVAKVLVAAGRRAALDGLGLPAFGIEPASLRVDETGLVLGNSWLYAVGDCCGRAMLTHQGKYQARITGDVIVARSRSELDGRPSRWSRHARTADELAVPRAMFTDPEAAMVGLTEEEAWEHGIRVRAVDLPIAVAGAWQHAVDYEGWARFLVDEDRQTLVGACFAGPDVAELLQSATIAITGEVTLERLWHAIPAFPTVSEVWLRFLEAYGL